MGISRWGFPLPFLPTDSRKDHPEAACRQPWGGPARQVAAAFPGPGWVGVSPALPPGLAPKVQGADYAISARPGAPQPVSQD